MFKVEKKSIFSPKVRPSPNREKRRNLTLCEKCAHRFWHFQKHENTQFAQFRKVHFCDIFWSPKTQKLYKFDTLCKNVKTQIPTFYFSCFFGVLGWKFDDFGQKLESVQKPQKVQNSTKNRSVPHFFHFSTPSIRFFAKSKKRMLAGLDEKWVFGPREWGGGQFWKSYLAFRGMKCSEKGSFFDPPGGSKLVQNWRFWVLSLKSEKVVILDTFWKKHPIFDFPPARRRLCFLSTRKKRRKNVKNLQKKSRGGVLG